jgi:hypothetical protein
VALYDGAIGSRQEAHAACAVEFTGAHLCHISEFVLSNSAATPPANGSWLDWSDNPLGDSTTAGSPWFGRSTGATDCNNWSLNTSQGATLFGDGGFGADWCNELKPLVCCNGSSAVSFAGFTTANAVFGGRHSMHAQCATDYPGAHMCHIAEYVRSNSTDDVPATGAWLDWSQNTDGSATTSGVPMAGRDTGATDCNNWTLTTSQGATVEPTGGFQADWCNEAKPIACCI